MREPLSVIAAVDLLQRAAQGVIGAYDGSGTVEVTAPGRDRLSLRIGVQGQEARIGYGIGALDALAPEPATVEERDQAILNTVSDRAAAVVRTLLDEPVGEA